MSPQVSAALHALVNLTTNPECQKQAGRCGLDSLMAFSRTRLDAQPQLQHLASLVISNLQKHPANRTPLYTRELRYRSADVRRHPFVRRVTVCGQHDL